MDAIVSGHAGVALLLDGKKLSSLHVGEDGIVPRRPSDVPLLLGGAGDLRLLKNIKLEQVRQQLQEESSRIDVLHLALILLDPELEDDTRQTAAEELEEELAKEGMVEWLEGVLYAHPLPKSADPVGARSLCSSISRVTDFLSRLLALQETIVDVHQAWMGIPLSLFGDKQSHAEVLSVLVRHLLFRELVISRSEGQGIDGFLIEFFKKPEIHSLRSIKHILDSWVFNLEEPIQQPPTSRTSFVGKRARRRARITRKQKSSLEMGLAKFIQTPTLLSTTVLLGLSNVDSSSVSILEAEVLGDSELQRYYRPLVALFQRKGFSKDESRDLALETVLIYKNTRRFREESSPGTWLFRIATNLRENTLRIQAAKKRDAEEIPLNLTEAKDLESEDKVLEQMLSWERSRLLREALEELPPQMKKAVMLRVTSDMKYREIAEEMKVSLETVKTHLYQARQHLRARLSDYFADDVL